MFRQTETQPVAKEYSDEDRAFIRSRLPVAKALKIGASGLKGKPFRLLATVFLSCVAFILFGLIIIAIAAAVAVVGTFVPVFLTARKKPVEAIRSL